VLERVADARVGRSPSERANHLGGEHGPTWRCTWEGCGRTNGITDAACGGCGQWPCPACDRRNLPGETECQNPGCCEPRPASIRDAFCATNAPNTHPGRVRWRLPLGLPQLHPHQLGREGVRGVRGAPAVAARRGMRARGGGGGGGGPREGKGIRGFKD